MKKEIMVSIIATILVTVLLFDFLVIKPLRKQNTELLKLNPWWEMGSKNCGRNKEADKNNTYCRGFTDGYDYCSQMKELNKNLEKIK